MARPFLAIICLISASWVALALVFVLFDPFNLYPWGIAPALERADRYSLQSTPYLVDAVAKTADIDTIFLGTSTGHFYTAEMMETILPGAHRAFNLSYGNPGSPDRVAVARQLLHFSHARRFILEADWTYMVPLEEQPASQGFPLYLYDTVWWNDVRGINREAIKLLSAVLRHEPLWIEAWSPIREKEGYQRRYEAMHTPAAIADFARHVSRNKASIDTPSHLSCESMSAIRQNLVPFVAALSARGAEVDVLMPAYSWLLYYWADDPDRAGLSRPSLLNDQLMMRRCVVQALDGLAGVRLFAFDDVPGLATDMRNYFDPVHLYNSTANRYVLRSIANDQHRLTRGNIDSQNAQMRLSVIQYQFTNDKIWTIP
jgi:hypothetical protein